MKDTLPLEMRLQHQKTLMNWHNRAPICRTFGMTLSYDQEECAVIHLPHNPRIDHGFGGIHGGVFATLLDNAGWFTVGPRFNTWLATVELQTRFLEHGENCDLIATGKIVRLGKLISVVEMQVCNAEGKIMSVGSGTFATTSVARPTDENQINEILKRYASFFP